MAVRDKLHFSRFEFKYVLRETLRNQIEAELQHFVELDPHVAGKAESKYFVRSLYFDDPSFCAFYDKIDGLHTRSKFRVRTYTEDSSGEVPQFLEVKGRYNNLVFKHRVPMDGGAILLERGDALVEMVLSHAREGKVRDQFEFELHRKRLRPNVLVDYFRRPYISKYDPEFRLTFDEKLRSTATCGLFPRPIDRSRRMLRGYTVMEVKFRHHLPSWFHRLIQCYELRRQSVSKVCLGTETLELAVDLS